LKLVSENKAVDTKKTKCYKEVKTSSVIPQHRVSNEAVEDDQ